MKNSDSRRLLSAAFAVAGIVLLTGCASGSLFNKYYDQGLEAMRGSNFDQAQNLFSLAEKQALKMEPGDTHRIDVWSRLAVCSAKLHDMPSADEYLTKARKDREQNPKSDPIVLVEAMNEIAGLKDGFYTHKNGLQLRRSAIDIQNSFSGKDGKETLALAKAYAQTCLKWGDVKEAESMCRKILLLEEKKYGKESPELSSTLEQYSAVLSRAKKKSEAEKIKARLKSLQIKVASGADGKPLQASSSEVKW